MSRTSPSELFLECVLKMSTLFSHTWLPNDLSIGRQHCQWSTARVRSRRLADAAKVHYDVQCDAIMTS